MLFFNCSSRFSVPKWKTSCSQPGLLFQEIFYLKKLLVGWASFFHFGTANREEQLKKAPCIHYTHMYIHECVMFTSVMCVYIHAFKEIWALTMLIIELHWSVNLPENIRSLVIGLTSSFIIIVLSCFSWWYRAWSPTPSPARRCNTDSCWKGKYLNILRHARCRVLVLVFICWLLYGLIF